MLEHLHTRYMWCNNLLTVAIFRSLSVMSVIYSKTQFTIWDRFTQSVLLLLKTRGNKLLCHARDTSATVKHAHLARLH